MGDLSKNFNKSEFACKCGCGYVSIAMTLVKMCQVIRDEMREPIRVNSGCRCEKHNKRVGGVANSYHVQGLAVDLSCKSGAYKLFHTIKGLHARGLLPALQYCKLYTRQNFVHIDIGRKRNNRFSES